MINVKEILQWHCYVVVEIKTGKFDSSYAGQLGTYVVAVNHQMKEISFETYKARERTIEKLEDELELAEEALENKYGIDD